MGVSFFISGIPIFTIPEWSPTKRRIFKKEVFL
jgi:hypothetical protein